MTFLIETLRIWKICITQESISEAFGNGNCLCLIIMGYQIIN